MGRSRRAHRCRPISAVFPDNTIRERPNSDSSKAVIITSSRARGSSLGDREHRNSTLGRVRASTLGRAPVANIFRLRRSVATPPRTVPIGRRQVLRTGCRRRCVDSRRCDDSRRWFADRKAGRAHTLSSSADRKAGRARTLSRSADLGQVVTRLGDAKGSRRAGKPAPPLTSDPDKLSI